MPRGAAVPVRLPESAYEMPKGYGSSGPGRPKSAGGSRPSPRQPDLDYQGPMTDAANLHGGYRGVKGSRAFLHGKGAYADLSYDVQVSNKGTPLWPQKPKPSPGKPCTWGRRTNNMPAYSCTASLETLKGVDGVPSTMLRVTDVTSKGAKLFNNPRLSHTASTKRVVERAPPRLPRRASIDIGTVLRENRHAVPNTESREAYLRETGTLRSSLSTSSGSITSPPSAPGAPARLHRRHSMPAYVMDRHVSLGWRSSPPRGTGPLEVMVQLDVEGGAAEPPRGADPPGISADANSGGGGGGSGDGAAMARDVAIEHGAADADLEPADAEVSLHTVHAELDRVISSLARLSQGTIDVDAAADAGIAAQADADGGGVRAGDTLVTSVTPEKGAARAERKAEKVAGVVITPPTGLRRL